MTLTAAGTASSDWNGTYIQFHRTAPAPGRKTQIWEVRAQGGFVLGQVKWFSRWRKYCFFANGETVYEQTCLADIAEFIVLMTLKHKQVSNASPLET
jgi:hypothetical protein